ncbi:MAG: hypothetical protein PHS94_02250 [Erysipelotrichaceae bacterium]|nr:hypothetical protein [Erysipelotrichaceae bacterium]
MNYSLEELLYLSNQGCIYARDAFHKEVLKLIESLYRLEALQSTVFKNKSYNDSINVDINAIIKAAHGYRDDRNCRLKTYLSRVISNKIKTSFQKDIKAKKGMSKYDYDDLAQFVHQGVVCAPQKIYEPDYYVDIISQIQEALKYANISLSKTENRILWLKVFGYDIAEIAKDLNKPVKAVYNGLDRIKQKMKLIKKV